MRVSPWDEPRSCSGANCSMAVTLWPHWARAAAILLPAIPRPRTMTLCLVAIADYCKARAGERRLRK